MTAKKTIKKVEIADDAVLNLKTKEKEKEKPAEVDFSVNRIDSIPMEGDKDFYADQAKIDSALEHGGVQASEPVPFHHRRVRGTATDLTSPHSTRHKYDPEELHNRMESFAERLEKAVIKVSSEDGTTTVSASPGHSGEPKEQIKVKFEKFVTLVATRNFLPILEKNRNEDIIMNSNLLTDLASAVEEKQEKRSPLIFIIGLAIGVIITYLLFNH